MLLIFSDVETLDHRGADRAQLIHDDRVPLLPARREPGPRRSLNVSDLIGDRHRPTRYQCVHPTRKNSLAGVNNAREGRVTPLSWPAGVVGTGDDSLREFVRVAEVRPVETLSTPCRSSTSRAGVYGPNYPLQSMVIHPISPRTTTT